MARSCSDSRRTRGQGGRDSRSRVSRIPVPPFCSHLIMRGALVTAVKELAGHRNMSTTMRYIHLAPGVLSDAIGLLDGWPGMFVESGQLKNHCALHT